MVDYIEHTHTPANARKMLADIDRRIAAAPAFPGLRRFHQGRNFKQWTGDDSKALMKVYYSLYKIIVPHCSQQVFLPAIVGYVPDQMVRAISSFMDFCYYVRRSVVDEDTLCAIDMALANFRRDRVIFVDTGVRNNFVLPRQHSLDHYRRGIQQFGALNGLCSSITESKHIKAVKKPWRRSSRWKALGQMLLINQRLDKLAAAKVDFAHRKMLDGPSTGIPVIVDVAPLALVLPTVNETGNDDDVDEGPVDGNRYEGEVSLARTKGTCNVSIC